MINFTFRGHKISIRNDDWRKLKERFNVENAERDGDEDYVVRISCSLCLRYKYCMGCPLNEIGRRGCLSIFNYIFRIRYFSSGEKYRISWLKIDNAKARRQLKAILRRMEKIEASQE